MTNQKVKFLGSASIILTTNWSRGRGPNGTLWGELRYEEKSIWATALTKVTLSTQTPKYRTNKRAIVKK